MAQGIKTGGRQKGTPNKTTLEHLSMANEAAKEGITPLEVIMRLMRRYWKEAHAIENGVEVFNEGKADKAATWAMAAAPYRHAKLQPIEASPDKPLIITDESSLLERARRVAFTLIQGARSEPRKALPAPAKPKTRKRVTA